MRKRTSRLDVYQNLRSELSADARAFWDGHQQDISAGVIHAGKFERYFRLFARYVRPLIHSDAATARLLASKSATEQADFYHQKWNTRRWRFLFRLFFSRWMMGNVGRDPVFLAQVQCDVSDYIFRKAEAHLTQEAATRNFILRYNLTGSFGDLLPDYLASEARFGMIRDRLNRLVLRPGYVQEAGREFGSFDAMNLSDIFEYMPVPVFQEVGKQLRQIAKPGCRIGYWNLMAPRRLSLDLPELFHYEAALSQTLTQSDRGFFYNQFILDTAL
jgi:S-adenosylmethionine-diacylglycerol 3-amino-3-carboxypropyl transferase